MQKIHLKGGSLSSTTLIIEEKKKFVRKEISLNINREYGYQRWYSQLKRIQRYNILFPGLYPELLQFGISERNTAYFDIEYIENSQTGYEFLLNERNPKKINKFFEKVVEKMHLMHIRKFNSSPLSIHLYLEEEVDRKIMDCMVEKSIIDELSVDFFNINNQNIPNIINSIDCYKKIFISNYNQYTECFTHGNITLENMLYNHENNQLFFVDPYDENIIDSKLAEYSQILQSSNSKYEYLINNDIDALFSKNEIFEGLNYFNKIFMHFLEKSLSENEVKTVKLFEISQFIRMLPFKLQVDKQSMLKFIKVASLLMHKYNYDYQ